MDWYRDALLFTDFQWVTFHLDEKSATRQLDGERSAFGFTLRVAGFSAKWTEFVKTGRLSGINWLDEPLMANWHQSTSNPLFRVQGYMIAEHRG